MPAKTEKAQIRLTRVSSAYWRVTFDNPPLNVMGPQFVREMREIVGDVDGFVDALARRIASFDKWAIANTKRLVSAASLPQDVEIAAGWDACMTSIGRPAAQGRIKALLEQGFHRPGDAEDRLRFYLGRLGDGG